MPTVNICLQYFFIFYALKFFCNTRVADELINFQIFNIPDLMAVSVIIPVFNKYIYLERCLNSLKRQTFQNFEIVISDDCSTDNSTTFIIEQMKINNKIKLVQHTYNQGTCSTRNHAVLSTKGEYIMSIDPDDEYYTNGIYNSYYSAIKFNADVLDFTIFVQKPNKTYILPACNKSYQKNTVVLDQMQKFDYHKSYWNICKKIVKRSIYYQSVQLIIPFVQYKRISNGEDLLHCGVIYIFMKNYICGHFTAYLYYKNVNDSASSRGYDHRVQGQMQIRLAKLLTKYFYKNRESLSKCSLIDFLANPKNSRVYHRVKTNNVSLVKSCDIDIQLFKCSKFENHGYCLIEHK